MPKYDWQEIKACYVEGILDNEGNRAYPTLEELASKYGPNLTTIKKRSTKDGWLQERNLFATKVNEARQAKRTEILASKGAEFDAKSLSISEKGLKLVLRALNTLDQNSNAASAQVNIVALKELAMSLEKYQRSGRLSLGDSTDNQKIEGGPVLNLSITKDASS